MTIDLAQPLLPRVLPPSWEREGILDDHGSIGHVYRSAFGLVVIVSAERWRDDRVWLHVSCSQRGRLPSWRELREVKDLFVGRDRKAIQVLPSEDEYVNVHPHVLHLWCAVTGSDPLPDFRDDRGMI